MDSIPPLVRIAVVQLSGKSAPCVADSSSGEGSAGSSATSSTEAPQSDEGQLDDTLLALQRLGDEVDLEVFQDADSCVACVAAGVVDLVVLDSPLAGAALGLLDKLQAGGPPAIVVIREEGNDAALEAFRRGAADCVRVGADYARVLPEMALEQMQRWREALERQSAERRISELQRYNENIIQNMNSALLVVGMDGQVGFANPRAGTILGADHDRLAGRCISDWFDPAKPDRGLISRTLDEGARFKGAETLITREDGRVIPIGISCSPLLGADGSKQGAVAIFQDLTEIKQLQRQVLQTEKMASIGQLAAGVAHEINNPMGFIHANLFQMAEYLDDLSGVWDKVAALQEAVAGGEGLAAVEAASAELRRVSEEVDLSYVRGDFSKAVSESQEGSERIRHIVHDLRDFSHQDTAEPMPADVNQCVDTTASIVWTMMKHSVELKKDYQELPNVRCFPMQLKQVFMNLLVNAYQAVEEQIGGSGARGEIEIRTGRRKGGVFVTIRDSGTGIGQSDLGRIFDPFFTTKEVGAGTGLGLSTSYSIVKRHGGTIHVESELGRGSTFEVWLPEQGVEATPEAP